MGHVRERDAGPLGAVVGGTVGAVAGTIGGILGAESGVIYYDVPAEYHVTGYRYTYVNDHAVLVDPRTHRIVQIID